jgi:hypothetical protein
MAEKLQVDLVIRTKKWQEARRWIGAPIVQKLQETESGPGDSGLKNGGTLRADLVLLFKKNGGKLGADLVHLIKKIAGN